MIQEAKIAKILNFDAAIYRNVVQIPPILFSFIKVPSFSFIIINITIACEIWIGFYGAAKKVAILGFFTVWIYAIFDHVKKNENEIHKFKTVSVIVDGLF